MTSTPDAATERLDQFEQRLRAIEDALAEAPADSAAGSGAADTQRFWALTGLRAQSLPAAGAVLFTGIASVPGGGAYEWQEGRPVEDLLDADWEETGTALAALASPIRMLLLHEVLGGRTSAAELTALETVGTSGQVYHHLRQLTAAGWLRTHARGRFAVPPERVIPLLVLVAAARR